MPSFLDSLPPLLARALRALRQTSSAPAKSTGAQSAGAQSTGSRSADSEVRDVPTAERSRRIAYAPDPDGGADPGEVVWAWVPFEEHDGRGKDRPLLVVGRDGDGGLLGLMLSSQHDRADDRDWLPVGSGDWDRSGRDSFVRLDRVLEVPEHGIRREGAVLPRDRFDRVADELRDRFGWN